MKAIMMFRGHGIIGGVFSSREKAIECLKEFIEKHNDDVSKGADIYENCIQIWYQNSKVHMVFEEVEMDSSDMQRVNITSELIPEIIKILEEYNWFPNDKRDDH